MGLRKDGHRVSKAEPLRILAGGNQEVLHRGTWEDIDMEGVVHLHEVGDLPAALRHVEEMVEFRVVLVVRFLPSRHLCHSPLLHLLQQPEQWVVEEELVRFLPLVRGADVPVAVVLAAGDVLGVETVVIAFPQVVAVIAARALPQPVLVAVLPLLPVLILLLEASLL